MYRYTVFFQPFQELVIKLQVKKHRMTTLFILSVLISKMQADQEQIRQQS